MIHRIWTRAWYSYRICRRRTGSAVQGESAISENAVEDEVERRRREGRANSTSIPI